MHGLEKSKEVFYQLGLPMLEAEFKDTLPYLAAGLAGQGSECLGFDDELSEDHDFGIDFCLWIPQSMDSHKADRLREAYSRLSEEMNPVKICITPERARRIGVHTTESFYKELIGLPRAPETNMEWLRIPETCLSAASNGQVFEDYLGQFSMIRKKLLGFYPEDVRRKKLAANCALMGQAGQYNYSRSLMRKDDGAAYLACADFVKAALAALYLLNCSYMPFYKWAFRGTLSFRLGGECVSLLKQLIGKSDKQDGEEKMEIIETVCIQIKEILIQFGWTDNRDNFMQYHAGNLSKGIRDPVIRRLHILAGGICR